MKPYQLLIIAVLVLCLLVSFFALLAAWNHNSCQALSQVMGVPFSWTPWRWCSIEVAGHWWHIDPTFIYPGYAP